MLLEVGKKVILFLDKKEYTITKIFSEDIVIKDINSKSNIITTWFADLKSSDGIIIERISVDWLQ